MSEAERLGRGDVARDLSNFGRALRASLGPNAMVDRTDYSGGRASTVTVRSTDPAAIGFAWSDTLDEVVLEDGQSRGWELDHPVGNLALLEGIVPSSARGPSR